MLSHRTDALKVYVLEVGVYNDRSVWGVYRTAEAAMEAWPKGKWTRDKDVENWSNDKDWDDAGTIYGVEVQG